MMKLPVCGAAGVDRWSWHGWDRAAQTLRNRCVQRRTVTPRFRSVTLVGPCASRSVGGASVLSLTCAGKGAQAVPTCVTVFLPSSRSLFGRMRLCSCDAPPPPSPPSLPLPLHMDAGALTPLDEGLLADIGRLAVPARTRLRTHYGVMTQPRCLVATDRTCLSHAMPENHCERPERLLACTCVTIPASLCFGMLGSTLHAVAFDSTPRVRVRCFVLGYISLGWRLCVRKGG